MKVSYLYSICTLNGSHTHAKIHYNSTQDVPISCVSLTACAYGYGYHWHSVRKGWGHCESKKTLIILKSSIAIAAIAF